MSVASVDSFKSFSGAANALGSLMRLQACLAKSLGIINANKKRFQLHILLLSFIFLPYERMLVFQCLKGKMKICQLWKHAIATGGLNQDGMLSTVMDYHS